MTSNAGVFSVSVDCSSDCAALDEEAADSVLALNLLVLCTVTKDNLALIWALACLQLCFLYSIMKLRKYSSPTLEYYHCFFTCTIRQYVTSFGSGFKNRLLFSHCTLFAGLPCWLQLPTIDHSVDVACRLSSEKNHIVSKYGSGPLMLMSSLRPAAIRFVDTVLRALLFSIFTISDCTSMIRNGLA